MNPEDNQQPADSPAPAPLERFSRWLVVHAARKSPAALTERLEEEWLADLAAQRGTLIRLHFAIGCYWAVRVIARDCLASGARTSGAATENGTIILGQYDSHLSRRTAIFFLIICLHVFVIYGFATGLAQKVIRAIPGPMHATILDQPRVRQLPPPAIQSRLTLPTPIFPKLMPTFVFPPDSISEPAIPQSKPQPPPALPSVPPKVVNRVLGGPGAGFPDTDDFYPLSARRLGEMGIATVRVCVDDKGRLTSAPAIAQSSGSARLDAAALQLAKAGSGHYRSTTEDGVPVAYCYPFRIRFQLTE